MEQSPSSKAIPSQLVKNLSKFHKPWKFVMFTSYHLSISWARLIQSTPSQTSILILFSLLFLGLPIGLFHSGLPTKILYSFLLSLINDTWLAHLILLDLITIIIFCWGWKSCSSLLCSFLHPPGTSSLLGQNIVCCYFYWKCLNGSEPE